MFKESLLTIFFCFSFLLGCSARPIQTASDDLQQKYLAQQKTIETLKDENSFLKSQNNNRLSLRGHQDSKGLEVDKNTMNINQSYQQLRQAEREFQNKNWFKVLKVTELITQGPSTSSIKSEAYLLRGQSFRRMGLSDQAKQCFEQSLKLNPDSQVKQVAQSELRELDFLKSKQRASHE